MLVCIPNVIEAAQIVSLRQRLENSTSWVDGRVTAGYQGAPVKFNQQIDERSETALACQRIIVPMLVLAGSDDPVVPLAQAEAVVAAMQAAGALVE